MLYNPTTENTQRRAKFSHFALLASLITVLLTACGPAPDSSPGRIVKGLPWQIEQFDDGTIQVFDIHLNHTTIEETAALLGRDIEAAIVIDQQNKASLELYAGHYKAGVLQGKLVVLADIDESTLAQMIQNLELGDYMASGARKLYPTDTDWLMAQKQAVAGLSFIPAINLDADIIEQRFGKAEQHLKAEGVEHFLYPKKGLGIAMSEQGKEVIQYISPRYFHKLSQPLLSDPSYAQVSNSTQDAQ